MKIYRKIAMYALMAVLTAGTIGILSYSANAANGDYDGDVITNPWYELFTKETASGDLPIGKDETTKKQDITTEKITTKAAVKPRVRVGRTVVKYAKKTKSSSKVKISLRKIKGAKKYQVQISKSKKFKKVLVKKTVKKVKFTLKSKKIKNKSKLYVRARAIKVVGKKTYAGKWSKAKKMKIKK